MKPRLRFRTPGMLWVLAFAVTACGDGESSALNGAVPPTPEQATSLCADSPLRRTATLFASETVPTFELSLPQERYDWLVAHALDEQYVKADLRFEGKVVGAVGLRFKGDYGTLALCLDENGKRLDRCPKLSMKLGFSAFDPGCRFYGLKHLNLHSMQWDDTKIHEKIAYDLYRKLGVPAPQSAWANVTLNGESLGIFSMVEQIDGRFTEENFPSGGDGDLYKEAWPRTNEPAYYQALLKTNESTANVAHFTDFYHALAEAMPQGRALSQVINRYTDRNLLERYLAVDDALVNWDGVTTFYVAEDDSWTRNHNYYWYRQPKDGLFSLIPWDLDNTLKVTKSIVSAPRWTEAPADCSEKFAEFSGDTFVFAPGCDPLFRGLTNDRTGYFKAVDDLLAGPFAETELVAAIETHSRFIQRAVEQDPLADYGQWLAAVNDLKGQVPLLHERLQRVRDGQSVRPLQLTLGAVNDFEHVSSYEVGVGVTATGNAASDKQVTLSVDSASGHQALRIDFAFRNEATAWGQWVKLAIGVQGAKGSVLGFQGLRVRVRAEQARKLDLQIASLGQTHGNEGVQNGWEGLSVTADWTEVLLPFNEARVPGWAVREGKDPGDPLESVLAQVTGFEFLPKCALCSLGQGFIANSGSDAGFLEVDSVEFY